jgi:hypothetical protein
MVRRSEDVKERLINALPGRLSIIGIEGLIPVTAVL